MYRLQGRASRDAVAIFCRAMRALGLRPVTVHTASFPASNALALAETHDGGTILLSRDCRLQVFEFEEA